MKSLLMHRVTRRVALLAVLPAGVLAGAALWSPASEAALSARVRRGSITARLTTTGTVRPIRALTYRSPVAGREVQILELVAEGSRVLAGDLLVRLDCSELDRDADRLRQELRQMKLDLQLAHGERQDAEAAVKMAAEGEGALAADEAAARLRLAITRAERLRREFDQLKPLLEKGFITREELSRTADELDQAEQELALARKRADVLTQLTRPRDQQRAALQLVQKNSQLENIVGRVQETEFRLRQTMEVIDRCAIRAVGPGLVVYEQFLSASPRRKIRVGDRVSASQGLLTIPEVDRMLVEASVGEAEVHRVKSGQPADVRLEAFPQMRMTGKVTRVGTLASASLERPLDDKRFDIVIELDSTNADLRPEMTARADIVVGRREEVLLVPVTAVFERQGGYVAYVDRSSEPLARPIDIGDSDGEFVEVRSGLSEGDPVLLVEPAGTPRAGMPAVPTSAVEQGYGRQFR